MVNTVVDFRCARTAFRCGFIDEKKAKKRLVNLVQTVGGRASRLDEMKEEYGGKGFYIWLKIVEPGGSTSYGLPRLKFT